MEVEERFERIERNLQLFSSELTRWSRENSIFQAEMRGFREEMLAFKQEMHAFKQEMLAFKQEMLGFKEEAERDRKQMNRAWGDLANKLGTILEDIAAPNIHRLAVEEFGFESVEDTSVRTERTSRSGPRRQTEFDVVCAGAQKVIYAEMKSKPDGDSIQAFANKLGEFFDFFPEYKGRQLIGIYASWSLGEKLRPLIAQSGLYGMAMADETKEIVVRPV